MKTIVAASIFLILGISSVFACVADYWSAGDDYIPAYSCPNVNTPDNLYKESYWNVKYPEQVGFRTISSVGTGKCSSTKACWPLFYTPQALNNLWRQKVDSQTISLDVCQFWSTKTYPLPNGFAPGPGDLRWLSLYYDL